MDSLAILLRAIGDYQQTVDTLLGQIADLQRQLAERRAEPASPSPNGAAEPQEAHA